MVPHLLGCVMSRRVARPLIALLVVLAGAIAPQQVWAYHFFYINTPLPFPVAWRSGPVAAIIDSGPATFITDAQAALKTWNDVTTAADVFGTPTTSAVNFTGANFGTAWGIPNDGKFELVCDQDGTAFTAAGVPNTWLGYGPTQQAFIGGQGAITDGFFILNCSIAQSTTFNYLGTMVHELGHTLGLAHSSVYLHDAGRLDPVAFNDAPTMYPFSLPNDALSATLEADDIAGISELYPAASFATSYTTLSGTVTRCGTTDVVRGVNVRAVSTSNSRTQITRYSGFDGNDLGYYEMKVPAGSYRLIIEVMTLPIGSMALLTPLDTDFAREYRSPAATEDACLEDLPDTAQTVSGVAGGLVTDQNFKTNAVELAFVVDDTGSMGPEIGAVRQTLTNEINRLKAVTGVPFPNTAIVTFKDDVTVRKVSRDPVVLQGIVNGLSASGGGDCPEWSNAALIVAGSLLRRGGTSMLFTDADSHPTGPDVTAVTSLYTSKGLRMSTLLSGTCSGSGFSAARPDASEMDPTLSQNPWTPGDGPAPQDRVPAPGGTLGNQSSIQTYSAISAATGGLFAAIPGIKAGTAAEVARYINTGTNVAVSATLPTVGMVSPGDGSLGTTIDLDIVGSNTNFGAGSVVTFSGTGLTVNFTLARSATSLSANVTIAAGATLGFRDVTVTTPLGGATTEVATGVGAFNIVTAPTTPTIIGVSPATGAQGGTVNVTIRGLNTNFTAASIPLFCTSTCTAAGNHDPKIVINSKTATNATTLVVNLSIAVDATVAFRNVTVLTGAESARESVVGPFLVQAKPLVVPRILSVSPNSATIGQTVTLSIVGENTTFQSGVSTVSFGGSGITVLNSSVTSATTMTATIVVSSGAAPGFRDVLVTTSSQGAALLNGFNVIGGPPTAHPATAFYAASIVGNVVTLRWTPPAGGLPPTHYVLEGGVVPGQTLGAIATGGPNPIFTFTAPSGAFYLRVHTMSGVERATPSNEIRVFVNTATAPSAPASLVGLANGNALSLAWRNTFTGGAPTNVVLDVAGPLSGSLPIGLADQFSFAGIPAGSYTFRVRGTNASGVSASSNPVTLTFPGTCTAPAAPANFLAYNVGRTINLIWDAPTTGAAPQSYVLNVSGAFNGSVPVGSSKAVGGTVGPGSYTVSVFAVNACGSSAPTATQTVVIP